MRKEGSISKTGDNKATGPSGNHSGRQKEVGLPLDRYFGKPEQIQKIKTPLYATLGFLVVIDLFVHRDHVTFIGDSIPGFSAVYGLISTVLIIFASKALGAGLMKREDYYDD